MLTLAERDRLRLERYGSPLIGPKLIADVVDNGLEHAELVMRSLPPVRSISPTSTCGAAR